MTRVHLTDEDVADALDLLSFNTLDEDGMEVIVDLDEAEAEQLRATGAVETVCAHTGRPLKLHI